MMFYMGQVSELTAAHKQVLQRQTIDEQSPGTILKDFDTIIDFVGEKEAGIPVTGTHLLQLKMLKPLNSRLTHTLELGLKRPQQQSYPHINGLYLLLRATGLGKVVAVKKKPHLQIDKDVLPTWTQMNPTERYFTLLETWAIRGQEEIIGERRGTFWSTAPIVRWSQFSRKVPDNGLIVKGESGEEKSLRYCPGLYNLALLEMFGLVTIDHGQSQEGEGWQVKRVERRPLGDALLALISTYLTDNFDEIFGEYDDPSDYPFGRLQPVIQPYFAEWQNNLTIPEYEFREGLYIFKVSLPQVWRQIAIPADLTLHDLSITILNAYEFDHDHLYEFIYTNRFGISRRIVHPYMSDIDESPLATDTQIGDLPLEPGAAMIFHYDFGDSWHFEVLLEKIERPDPNVTQPVVRETHGQPPEQYGW